MEKNNNRILLGLYNFSSFSRLIGLANSNFRVMSWSRFEYFLNAIYYSIWLGEIRNSKRIEKIVYAIFNPLLRFLLTESQHDALLERRQKYASRNKKFVNDMNIGCANSWFGLVYFIHATSVGLISF